MKKRYTFLQFKRYLKKFPAVFTVAMITLCVIAAGLWTGVGKNDGERNTKICVGVTGDVDNTYLEVGIYALKNLDSSRFAIEFLTMTEKEAKKALENREIYGYVHFPKGFVESIERGENKPATYYVSKNSVNLGSVMTEEISTMVSDLVVEVQRAVYSMRKIARDEGIKKGLGKRAMEMNEILVTRVLGRSKLYDIKTIGVRDNLSFGGYYLGSVITVFLLLWGLFFATALGNRSVHMQRLMKASGVSEYQQIKGELGAFFSFTLFMLFFLLICFYFARDYGAAFINELEGTGFFEFAVFFVKIIPVVSMICAMHIFLYEITDNMVSAILLQLMLLLVGGYISGCFYPGFFFPDAVTKAVDFLPVGAAFSYIRKALCEGVGLGDFVLVCAYGVGFFAFSGKVRQKRMAGEGR